MQPRLLALLIAAALGLAACGKQESKDRPASGGTSGTSQPQANTTTTPANIGTPGTTAERREGATPQQQQVDPKEPAQNRDFQQRGDGAGPKSPETSPGPGAK